MGSSKPRRSLFDPWRKGRFIATPEEMVRQRTLEGMCKSLGFPKELISVEKSLSELPHLEGRSDLPIRRVDMVCFAKGIHPDYPLYPLLLLECKQGKALKEAHEQALGYNYFAKAPFVAIADEDGARLIFPKELDFLPSYAQLLNAVQVK